jgi:hypothetical protein
MRRGARTLGQRQVEVLDTYYLDEKPSPFGTVFELFTILLLYRIKAATDSRLLTWKRRSWTRCSGAAA